MAVLARDVVVAVRLLLVGARLELLELPVRADVAEAAHALLLLATLLIFEHHIFSGVSTPIMVMPFLITLDIIFKKTSFSSEILLFSLMNLLLELSFPKFQYE